MEVFIVRCDNLDFPHSILGVFTNYRAADECACAYEEDYGYTPYIEAHEVHEEW